MQTQADQLAARFNQLFGTSAQVAVGIPTSGFSAETVRSGGVTTITVAPGVPATALPFIMGHEMGHAHQFRTGQVDPDAPDNQGVELGATFIAGQFLRRGGYALEDAVNYVRSGAAGDFLHGTVDQQVDALRRGYQSA